jgi:hypothetical protein
MAIKQLLLKLHNIKDEHSFMKAPWKYTSKIKQFNGKV